LQRNEVFILLLVAFESSLRVLIGYALKNLQRFRYLGGARRLREVLRVALSSDFRGGLGARLLEKGLIREEAVIEVIIEAHALVLHLLGLWVPLRIEVLVRLRI
jgi:hypothetical protein